MLYDVIGPDGQLIVTYGADGPVDFVSNLERQTVQEIERIQQRIASGAYAPAPASLIDAVAVANEGVRAALYADGLVEARTCLQWGRADQGWFNRGRYAATCTTWEDNLNDALRKREQALTAVADYSPQAVADAETSRALAEQSTTASEQVTAVFEPLLPEIKPETGIPTWMKVAGIAVLIGGTGLIAARVLLPPLFAVYLQERRA